MKPFQGTVAASDFNSILSNLNTASDRTSSDLIKRATEGPDTGNISTFTADNGTVTGINKLTGEIVWQQPGIGNVQDGPTTKTPRLTPEKRTGLLGAGFTSAEVDGLESRINEFGIEAVLRDPSLTSEEKKRLSVTYEAKDILANIEEESKPPEIKWWQRFIK